MQNLSAGQSLCRCISRYRNMHPHLTYHGARYNNRATKPLSAESWNHLTCSSVRYSWWKTELWFRLATIVTNKTIIVASPERVTTDSGQHSNEKTDECKSSLALCKAVVVFKDERKCTKEEVQDAKQNCRFKTEQSAHWLSRQ